MTSSLPRRAAGDGLPCVALIEMRAKLAERARAIALRRQGLSYSESQTRVPVSQASLSLWLRDIELEESQRRRLSERKAAGHAQAVQKVRQLKLERIANTTKLADLEANQFLNSRELLWVIGTVLYWAEGTKVSRWSHRNEHFQFTNMDSDMILLVRKWLEHYCLLTPDDFVYALYIHPDADVISAQDFWARALRISQTSFRTYFKRHNPSPRRNHVGRTYYGTMRLSVRRSTQLTHRVMSWIRALIRHCGVD